MHATVIIPNYNGIHFIEECLAAIYAGTQIPEVIVVDNASKDGSCELVEEKYPQVNLVKFQTNKGFCSAVNKGIELANTKYVILLNNDTKVEKKFVEELVKAIECRKDAFSVGAKMLSMKEPDKIDDAGDLYCALGWAFALGKDEPEHRYNRASEIFASCAGAAIYRKSVFEKIGYFDENHFAYLEDIDIGYRAKIFGYHNYFEPRAVVYHEGSSVSGSRYNAFKTRLTSRNSIYLIYKNMPILQILCNFIFLVPGFFIKFIFFIKKGLGIEYAYGIAAGIKMCFSKNGRAKKVRVQRKHFGNYLKIQLELWINIFRRIFG